MRMCPVWVFLPADGRVGNKEENGKGRALRGKEDVMLYASLLYSYYCTRLIYGNKNVVNIDYIPSLGKLYHYPAYETGEAWPNH